MPVADLPNATLLFYLGLGPAIKTTKFPYILDVTKKMTYDKVCGKKSDNWRFLSHFTNSNEHTK